jgi:hypothetical protein
VADLEYGYCDCKLPCTCVEFEDKTYPGLESIIDALVRERNGLRAVAELVDGLEAERDDLLDYVKILEIQAKIRDDGEHQEHE